MEKKILSTSQLFLLLLLFLSSFSSLNETFGSSNKVIDINKSSIDYKILFSNNNSNNNFFQDSLFYSKDHWKNISNFSKDDLGDEKTKTTLILRIEISNNNEYINSPALLIENSLSNFKIFSSNGKLLSSSIKNENIVGKNNDLLLSVERDRDLYLISLSDFKFSNNNIKNHDSFLYLTTEFSVKNKLGKIDKIQFGDLNSLSKLSILDSGSFFNDFMSTFSIIFSLLFFFIYLRSKLNNKAKKVYFYFSFLLLSIGIDFLFNNLNFSYLLSDFMNGISSFLRMMNQFLLPIWFILFVLTLYENKDNRRGNKILKIALWHLLVIILYYLVDKYIIPLYQVDIYYIYNIFEITIIGYFFYLYFFKSSTDFKKDLFSNFMIGAFFILIVVDSILTYTSLNMNISSNFNLLSYGFLTFSIAFIYILFDNYFRLDFAKDMNRNYSNNNKNAVNYKENETELKRLRTQIIDFRNHLNPVFMNNTFEKMSKLISKDNSKALDFSKELFGVYNYLLNNEGKELSTIKEELKFVESYYFLYSRCFDGDLFLRTDVDEVFLLKKIPMLTLQLLFEHAVKYNSISLDNNLTIGIFIEETSIVGIFRLIIRYNLKKKNRFKISSGIALTNLRERFSFFTDEKVEIIDEENSLTIKLPLI